MSDYAFIVGNGVAILMLAIAMGFLGGAEDFTSDDVIIGDAEELVETGVVDNVSEVDFDVNRLVYQPEFTEPPVTGRESGFTWSGQTNDIGQEYGYLTYNVSNISGEQKVYYETTSVIFRQIDFYGDESQILSEPESDVINNGAIYDLTGVDVFEVRLVDESATFLGFENDDLDASNFENSSSVERRTFTVQEGFFDKASQLIDFSFTSIGEIFNTLGAWIDFIWFMPGLAGWFLKGYIGIVFAYFLVKEVWLG